MSEADPASRLREQGVALLRCVFAKDPLIGLRVASERLFEAAKRRDSLAERYRFNPYSHSVLLSALADFGCQSEDLLAPLAAPGLSGLFEEAMGGLWACRIEQSWVRKKFAPGQTSRQAPDRRYQLQDWHQDGALGVQFPADPGLSIPMTELLTCWIPLNDCGRNSPGLEFIHGRRPALLHYTELGDSLIRQRYPAEAFWAAELSLGDGLVFLNSVLHRTHVTPEMRENRVSVEYRIFPA